MLQPNQENEINSSSNPISNGITHAILTLPWSVAYIVVLRHTNTHICTGIPLQFGLFARWAYLAAFCSLFFTAPLDFFISKAKKGGKETPLENVNLLFKSLHGMFTIGIWVYACVALSKRDDCPEQELTRLLWGNVLFPAAMMGCVFGLWFCLFCIYPMITGTASKFRYNSKGDDNTQQKPWGAETNPDLKSIRIDLAKKQKEIQSQITSTETHLPQIA